MPCGWLLQGRDRKIQLIFQTDSPNLFASLLSEANHLRLFLFLIGSPFFRTLISCILLFQSHALGTLNPLLSLCLGKHTTSDISASGKKKQIKLFRSSCLNLVIDLCLGLYPSATIGRQI